MIITNIEILDDHSSSLEISIGPGNSEIIIKLYNGRSDTNNTLQIECKKECNDSLMKMFSVIQKTYDQIKNELR